MVERDAPVQRTAETMFRGAKVARKQMARNVVPAMPVPEPQDDPVKREAYQLALAHRRKPWARRYLKSLSRGRLSW